MCVCDVCTLNARHPWDAEMMRESQDTGLGAAVVGSKEEAPPHSRVGRAGQENLTSGWRRAGRVFQAVQNPYVQRPRGR